MKNKSLLREMKVKVTNEAGLHARPASEFVQAAKKFKSTIRVIKDGIEADAKSIISVLSLGVEKGMEISIIAEGEDAEEAIKELVSIIRKNGDES